VLRRDDGRSETAGTGDRPAALPWRDPRLWVVVGVYAVVYAWITSIQIHFHAYQTDAGRSHALASSILGLYLLVGAAGSPLFGWLAQRTSACFTLLLIVVGLTVSAAVVWQLETPEALQAWAIGHGLVNSGVVAVLALVLHELFGPSQIGRLMGVAMVFCMTATLVGNQWAAWVFDSTGSYVPAWQVYAVLMATSVPPVWWLWRTRARPAAVSATRTRG
jgi:MFS family permease